MALRKQAPDLRWDDLFDPPSNVQFVLTLDSASNGEVRYRGDGSKAGVQIGTVGGYEEVSGEEYCEMVKELLSSCSSPIRFVSPLYQPSSPTHSKRSIRRAGERNREWEGVFVRECGGIGEEVVKVRFTEEKQEEDKKTDEEDKNEFEWGGRIVVDMERFSEEVGERDVKRRRVESEKLIESSSSILISRSPPSSISQLVEQINLGIDIIPATSLIMRFLEDRVGLVLEENGEEVVVNQISLSDQDEEPNCSPSPISSSCSCPTCTHYSLSYICHLLKAGELLGEKSLILHNMYNLLSISKKSSFTINN